MPARGAQDKLSARRSRQIFSLGGRRQGIVLRSQNQPGFSARMRRGVEIAQ